MGGKVDSFILSFFVSSHPCLWLHEGQVVEKEVLKKKSQMSYLTILCWSWCPVDDLCHGRHLSSSSLPEVYLWVLQKSLLEVSKWCQGVTLPCPPATSQSSLIYPIISLLWVPYTLIGHPLGQASFMSQDQWFPMFKAHTFFPRCVQLAKLLTPSRLCHPRQPQTSSGFSWKKVVTSHYMHTSQTPVDTPLALVRTLQLHPTSMPLPGVQLSRHSTRK